MAQISLSSKLFHYDSGTKTFSQYISSLPLQARVRNIDSFTLVGQKNNTELTFVLDKTDYEGPAHEREIAGWNYRPDEATKRKVPSCSAVRVLIIND